MKRPYRALQTQLAALLIPQADAPPGMYDWRRERINNGRREFAYSG
jgi:hypothetical protein